MAKKDLIIYLPDREEYIELPSILSSDYSLLKYDTKEEVLKKLNDSSLEIAAVLFDGKREISEDFSILNKLEEDKRFADISAIAVSAEPDETECKTLIEHNVNEYMVPPFNKDIVLLRVNNAIRSKDSATFFEIERMLQELPSLIYLKDKDCRYVFSTHYWHHLDMSSDPNWTIRGKSDIDIRKDKQNAMKAMESDKEIIRTGKGTSYIIEENEDGVKEYLELIKRPTHDAEGNVNGIIALINDVTEMQMLKQELEKRSRSDALTGILNRSATEEAIKDILREEGSHGALMMVDCDRFKEINDTFGHASGDNVLITIGQILHSNTKGMDVTGRIGGDEFVVYLKDIDSNEDICTMAEHIENQAMHVFDNDILKGYVSLSIGIARFPEDGKTFEELYKSADKALYHAKACGKANYKFYTPDL
ncbi:MAG: diguanylate cyclase [Erysipelotrichaceae bacterium]|nr:diguanylate cyclase [Erysipelotrichaceae bacterium]